MSTVVKADRLLEQVGLIKRSLRPRIAKCLLEDARSRCEDKEGRNRLDAAIDLISSE